MMGQALPFQPDEYYEYVLSGVLVHTGGADRGHYYSFVKERLTRYVILALLISQQLIMTRSA